MTGKHYFKHTLGDASMSKRGLVLLAGLWLLPLLMAQQVAGAENSCVRCHQDLTKSTFIGSKYLDWQTSIHAKEGVTCNRCHGGDPSAAQKEAAHAGVYNSSDPRSRVYYKQVPGMCGACHRRDLNAFKRSIHYTFLEQIGAGPTCVTCHESHATEIITPRQIPSRCEECHNKRTGTAPEVPMRAQGLLLLINETASLVTCAKEKVPADNPQRVRTWKETYVAMETVRDEWHAFDFSQVQNQILDTYDRLKAFLRQGK
jgi:hypothetical protein